MERRRPKKRMMAEINVVPYIDVMLVLLVIFMVTAPLLQQGVQVELPEADAKALEPSDKEPMIVSVNSKGQYFLNVAENPNLPVTNKELMLRVAAELKRDKNRKVLVKGDTRVDYGQVMGAMVVLQKAGAKGVGLITRDEGTLAQAEEESKRA